MSKTLPSAKTVAWHRILDDQSDEHATFVHIDDGYRILGTVLAQHEEAPLRAEYQIDCDLAWQTVACAILQDYRGERKELFLRVNEKRWLINGRQDETLNGCIDIDLGLSPSTNTLPINRVPFNVGENRKFEMAWVKSPELTVARLPQSYERLAERRYRYRSLETDFTALLDVDEDGVVEQYERIWKRTATATSAAASSGAIASAFASRLLAPFPAGEVERNAHDFAFLIGGWSAVFRDRNESGSMQESHGQWWFSWVLEGRAIQDVIVDVPRRRLGTTVRTYDVKNGVWRIAWITPASGVKNQLAGKRTGNRIVLEGETDGRPARWSFNDISDTHFVWRGEILDRGEWESLAEFELTRLV